MEEKMNLQEEFTFKKFFALIKRSGKRILIFAIIGAIIGACIASVIGMTIIGAKEYSIMIEYTHQGIQDGLAPDGTVLDYKTIKSPLVVSAALSSMGYSDSQVANLAPDVEDALSITPYISSTTARQISEDPNFEFVPSRYIVSVDSESIGGFNDTKYLNLLNSIAEEYKEYFKTIYRYNKDIVDVIGEGAVDYVADYYDLVQLYLAQQNFIEAVIYGLPAEYSAVAKKLTTKLVVFEGKLNSVENYIYMNNVQKENAIGLKNTLSAKRTELEIKSQSCEEQITQYTATIDSYNQQFEQVIIGPNGSTSIAGADTATYNELIRAKKQAIANKANYDSEVKLIDQKLALIPDTACTAENIQEVEARFDDLYAEYTQVLTYFDTEISEYTDLYIMGSGVRVVSPASFSSQMQWIAVVASFVGCVFAGCVVAVAVTSMKENKKK